MRDEQIYYPKNNSNTRFKEDSINRELVIDDVFFKLTRHYSQHSSLDKLKLVFTVEDYFDDVINIISKTIISSKEMNKFDDTIFVKFNEIINEISSK